jgi:hypothetical protein
VVAKSSDGVHQFSNGLEDGKMARSSDMGTVASKVCPYGRQIDPYQRIKVIMGCDRSRQSDTCVPFG